MNRTNYPRKDFDDRFEGLVNLCREKGWVVPGLDPTKLADEVRAQRRERADHESLKAKYREAHESFGLRQEQRAAHFQALLEALRGIFRKDKAVLAQLAIFTGTQRRNGTRTEATAVK